MNGLKSNLVMIGVALVVLLVLLYARRELARIAEGEHSETTEMQWPEQK